MTVISAMLVIAYITTDIIRDYLVIASVLWRCWLGCRKGNWTVKTEWWGASMVICLERGADLHMAQLMLLPLTVSCCSKIRVGFTFLVPAYLSSRQQRTVKRLCVCTLLLLIGLKRRWRFSVEMHIVSSRGSQTKRKIKEDMEKNCQVQVDVNWTRRIL